MKRIDHIIGIVTAMLLSAASLSSCSDDGEEDSYLSDSICVNTLALDSGRVPKVDVDDNTFTVLFWLDKEHLETNFNDADAWSTPYLAGHAPQPVAFYERSVYDLRYPYPRPETTYLYATGYAPGSVLDRADGDSYRTLITTSELTDAHRGRYDFLGCDVWSDVYRGSRADPFAQDKNRLYFRHLAAKLLVFADRDKKTMENKQFVRDVRVTNLKMSIDGGATWTSMFTPSKFEWQELNEGDFTPSYTKTINTVKTIRENLGVTSVPKAGYKTVAADAFAGDDSGFMLQTNAADRVPIYGMFIDSCYVCNPFNNETGVVQTGQPIKLKMDITAELSFDPHFPLEDDPSGTPGDGSGTTTDNLTFTRTWEGMTVAVKEVDKDGNKAATPVYEFKPGYEYRIYIHFHRTGVDLVARELPWYDGGSHYIPISGGNPQNGEETGGTTGGETGGGTESGNTGGTGTQTSGPTE